MTDLEKELLTKVQALHDVIERHPYLSGMVTDDFHGHLDFVIQNARHLDGIDRKEWRKQPDEDAVEEWL